MLLLAMNKTDVIKYRRHLRLKPTTMPSSQSEKSNRFALERRTSPPSGQRPLATKH